MNFDLQDFGEISMLIVVIIFSFQTFYLPTTNKEWKSLFSLKFVPYFVVNFLIIFKIREIYDRYDR
jgi:hypothetical protein